MHDRIRIPNGMAWLISLVIGITLSLSLGTHLWGLSDISIMIGVGFIGLFFLGSFLAYILFIKIVYPGLREYSPKSRILWTLISLAAGCLLVITLPITTYPKLNVLKIDGLAEKNEASQGNEVWLLDIQAGNQAQRINLAKVCKGDWLVKDSSLVFVSDLPSQLVCRIVSNSQIAVSLLKHPWSGKVRLIFDQKILDQDLYSPIPDQAIFNLPVSLTDSQRLGRDLLSLAHGMTIGYLLLALSLLLVKHPLGSSISAQRRTLGWFVYAIPIALIWLMNLLVYWPGILTPDSVYQLKQIVEKQLYDWHPAIHTMLIWLLTRFWFSPAPVAIAQILLLSSVLGWGLALIDKKGSPRGLVWLAAAFLALSPAPGFMALAIWKDIPYSIAVVALSLIVLQIVSNNGQWVDRRFHWISLAVVAAFTCLFRHNGVLVGFGTIAMLVICYSQFRRYLAFTLGLAVVIWLVVRGPLYWAVGVDTTNVTQGKVPVAPTFYISIIDWHIRSGAMVEPEIRQLFAEIQPQEGNRKTEILVNRAGDLKKMAIELTRRNPRLTLNYLLSRSAFIFQILQPTNSRIDNISLDVYPNDYGIQSASILPGLQPWINQFNQFTEKPTWDWLFWRNAFWMYVLIFLGIVASIRTKSWKMLLLLAPVLLNVLPYAVFNGGHIARYILPTLLMGPLLTPYLLSAKSLDERQVDDQPRS